MTRRLVGVLAILLAALLGGWLAYNFGFWAGAN